MCTVSYVCSDNKIIITSNRDEQVLRPALPPKNYTINNRSVIFPKDPKAGGTWYALDEDLNIAVLLNGAAEKHKWNPPYRKSRGVIVIEMIGSGTPLKSWETLDLDNIEPFTIVLLEKRKLYQLRWNGTEKEKIQFNEKQSHIWSSTTLYPKEIREQRAEWFYRFLDTKPHVDENEMFDFHRYTQSENNENGLVINRNEKLKTLSITQTVIEKNKAAMVHHDLIAKNKSAHSFIIV
jgi:hypothetical protein